MLTFLITGRYVSVAETGALLTPDTPQVLISVMDVNDLSCY